MHPLPTTPCEPGFGALCVGVTDIAIWCILREEWRRRATDVSRTLQKLGTSSIDQQSVRRSNTQLIHLHTTKDRVMILMFVLEVVDVEVLCIRTIYARRQINNLLFWRRLAAYSDVNVEHRFLEGLHTRVAFLAKHKHSASNIF